ncbi:MAG: hypothetical protein Q8908_12510, partial [Bacteroidota bacterium]|nr:hypothetical protein [Bacteroidota bacterium]
WMSQWVFQSKRVITTSDNDMINVQDYQGADVTREVLSNPNGVLLIVSYDLEKASTKALNRVIDLGNQATTQYVKTVLLTSSAGHDRNFIAVPAPMHFEFFNVDDVQLKMLVRANPGIVLIKDGVIMGKWSSHELPTVNKLHQMLQNQPAKSKNA